MPFHVEDWWVTHSTKQCHKTDILINNTVSWQFGGIRSLPSPRENMDGPLTGLGCLLYTVTMELLNHEF